VVLGLAAALVWGAGDFGGGLTSRRSPVYGVVLVSQGTGLVLTGAIALALGEGIPAGRDLLICFVAGVLGAVGITMLYRGLAIGRMGIVAPVTGVLAAVIPVVVGFATEGVPGPIAVTGIIIAVIAVVLVSRVADADGREGLTEALIAGTTIGLFGVAIAQLSEGNVFSALMVIRLAQGALVAAVVLVMRAAWRPGVSILPALVAIGLLDTAGNAFYLLAVQTGQLAIASVLSAMYPVATVVLAVVVLREPLTRNHTVGIVLAGIAIALIGAGGG
jgi:drug/metabolite transporter (DMT)-like permease